jgi:hypothetical protein
MTKKYATQEIDELLPDPRGQWVGFENGPWSENADLWFVSRDTSETTSRNARFIAAAPAIVRQLLEEREALRKNLERISRQRCCESPEGCRSCAAYDSLKELEKPISVATENPVQP